VPYPGLALVLRRVLGVRADRDGSMARNGVARTLCDRRGRHPERGAAGTHAHSRSGTAPRAGRARWLERGRGRRAHARSFVVAGSGNHNSGNTSAPLGEASFRRPRATMRKKKRGVARAFLAQSDMISVRHHAMASIRTGDGSISVGAGPLGQPGGEE
jgi:hypothetical protein